MACPACPPEATPREGLPLPLEGRGRSPTTEGSCSEGKHSGRFEMQRIESQTECSSNFEAGPKARPSKANTGTGHRALINRGGRLPGGRQNCRTVGNESKHESPLLIVVNIYIMSTVLSFEGENHQ